MESRIWNIWNYYQDIQQSPVLKSVGIITKNVEVGFINCEVLCKWIRDKHAKGANREPGK